MAIKFSSSDWLSALDEIRSIRDNLRKEFFGKLSGGKTVTFDQLDIPIEQRFSNMMNIIKQASENRIEDSSVIEVALLAQKTLIINKLTQGISPSQFDKVIKQNFRIVYSPEELKKTHFVTDEITNLENALVE